MHGKSALSEHQDHVTSIFAGVGLSGRHILQQKHNVRQPKQKQELLRQPKQKQELLPAAFGEKHHQTKRQKKKFRRSRRTENPVKGKPGVYLMYRRGEWKLFQETRANSNNTLYVPIGQLAGFFAIA